MADTKFMQMAQGITEDMRMATRMATEGARDKWDSLIAALTYEKIHTPSSLQNEMNVDRGSQLVPNNSNVGERYTQANNGIPFNPRATADALVKALDLDAAGLKVRYLETFPKRDGSPVISLVVTDRQGKQDKAYAVHEVSPELVGEIKSMLADKIKGTNLFDTDRNLIRDADVVWKGLAQQTGV